MSEQKGPILYVLVIGFHHKKGCQVEYSFPPLVPESPNECPPGWKYLPTLALPDGAHNYNEDTVYFHLPSLTNPRKTVYGISCFRQIPVEKLKNLTADITRGTVQKSVCVLSEVPLYGHIQVKMALITHAYFDEGDFSKVSLLEDTYHHLNSVIISNDTSLQTFVGLSARDFILQWRHKALLLFKLILLERRVVLYKSPVHPLCSTLLTLLSLHPGMIEHGLDQSACIKLSRPMSPMPNFSDDDGTPENSPQKSKYPYNPPNSENPLQMNGNKNNKTNDSVDNNATPSSLDNVTTQDIRENTSENCQDGELTDNKFLTNSTELGIEITECNMLELKKQSSLESGKKGLHRDNSAEALSDNIMHNHMLQLAQIKTETCGFPLSIFKQGYLCLPYLSLPYLDLLSDVNVRGYIIGATNVLFKQKRQLYDILVDFDGCRIECQDMELRKQLHLTTEDLRFADYIVKHVSEERHDVFLDGVGWEGGDEWIRAQFKVYLLCLLRTSLLQDGSREIDHFNSNFMSAWKDTHNYKMWNSADSPGIFEVNPGHPFAGQLSVADMKLRLSHTMQNTEGGRKFNQAMASTGRAVATTSKAVGGAFSQAKGAFSNWFSNLLVSPDPVQKGVEATQEDSTEEKSTAAKNSDNNQKSVDNNQTSCIDGINIPIENNISKECKEVANGIILNDKIDICCKEEKYCNENEFNNENYKVGEINTV